MRTSEKKKNDDSRMNFANSDEMRARSSEMEQLAELIYANEREEEEERRLAENFANSDEDRAN